MMSAADSAAASRFTVATLGNSIAFGQDVPPHEAWPMVLQPMLRKPGL